MSGRSGVLRFWVLYIWVMTVKELRELLAEAPDDLPVMVMVENHLKPGMFAFAEACTCETGLSKISEGEEEDGNTMDVFLVLPHGAGIAEEDLGSEAIPELN